MKAKYVQRLKIVALAIATLCVVHEGQGSGFVSTVKISDDIRRMAVAVRANPNSFEGWVPLQHFQSLQARAAIRSALAAKDATEAGLHLMELPSSAMFHLKRYYEDQWRSSMEHRDEMADFIFNFPNGNAKKQALEQEIISLAGEHRSFIADNMFHANVDRDLLRKSLRELNFFFTEDRAILEACDQFAFGESRVSLLHDFAAYDKAYSLEAMTSNRDAAVSLYTWLVSARRMLLDANVVHYKHIQFETVLESNQITHPKISIYDLNRIKALLTFARSKLGTAMFGEAVRARINYLADTNVASSQAEDATSMLTNAADEPSQYPYMIQELYYQLSHVVKELG